MVVPPRWFDRFSPELQMLTEYPIGLMQSQLRLGRGFDYELEKIRGAASEVRQCAESLAETGPDLIAQYGVPFSATHGYRAATALSESIEKSCTVPFEMLGLSLPLAARALGCETIAIAGVYYDRTWTQMFVDFLTEAGLTVLYAKGFVTQGIFRDDKTVFETSMHGFAWREIESSILTAREASPAAECIMVPGMPAPFLAEVPAMEARVGCPVIGYYALYRRILLRLGLKPFPHCGQLFATA